MKFKVNKIADSTLISPAVIEFEDGDMGQHVRLETSNLIKLLKAYEDMDIDRISLFVETDKPILISPMVNKDSFGKKVVGIALAPIIDI